jgi:DNA-binding phage protein
VFPPSAPLLEEERNLRAEALFPNLAHPLWIHRACVRAALAADDDPIDSVKVEWPQRRQKWLDAQETHPRIDLSEAVDPPMVRGALDADAEPHVWRNRPRPRELEEPIGPFSQHLKLVLRGLRHHLENPLNELSGHVLVEQVGHAVDEDQTPVTPLDRKVERGGDQAKVEPLLEWVTWRSAESLGESFRVAVFAARRDFGAAPNGVPGRVSPLDLAAVTHVLCILNGCIVPSVKFGETRASNGAHANNFGDSAAEVRSVSSFPQCRLYATLRSMDRTAFDDFFDEQMADPVRAEAYREARAEIDTYDRFMRAMNALRESRGVSKAMLASKSGLPAQSVRKVLTDRKANPTIATVFRLLSTMGFGLQVVPLKRKSPRRPAAKPARDAKRTSARRHARVAAG